MYVSRLINTYTAAFVPAFRRDSVNGRYHVTSSASPVLSAHNSRKPSQRLTIRQRQLLQKTEAAASRIAAQLVAASASGGGVNDLATDALLCLFSVFQFEHASAKHS